MSSIASAAPAGVAPALPRLLTRRVLAWALSDLGNTIFSMNVALSLQAGRWR